MSKAKRIESSRRDYEEPRSIRKANSFGLLNPRYFKRSTSTFIALNPNECLRSFRDVHDREYQLLRRQYELSKAKCIGSSRQDYDEPRSTSKANSFGFLNPRRFEKCLGAFNLF